MPVRLPMNTGFTLSPEHVQEGKSVLTYLHGVAGAPGSQIY